MASERNVVRLLLNLSDNKTKKPSNFHEWYRCLKSEAQDVLWLHGDYALLENSTLSSDHALVKKLKFTLGLLQDPDVKANVTQAYKLQSNADDVLAKIEARREEVWAFVTSSVSKKSMEKLERSHLQDYLALRREHDVPGLIQLLCKTHMLAHAHNAGQNRLAILAILLSIRQGHDEELTARELINYWLVRMSGA